MFPTLSPSSHPSSVPSLIPSSIPSLTPTESKVRKILAFDGDDLDSFGYSVDVYDDIIVIGAVGDDSRKGAAYLYNADGTLIQKLIPPGGHDNEYFGHAVSISSDAVLVGAFRDDVNGFGSGSAYLFSTDGAFNRRIIPSDGAVLDFFGDAVAILGDTIVIGAYEDDDKGDGSGSAYIFSLSDATFSQKITAPDGQAFDYFGESVAISDDKIVVGAYGTDENGSESGSAYIFNIDGTFVQKLVPFDGVAGERFGYSLAISESTIVIGAYRDNDNGTHSGAAYIYTTSGVLVKKILAPDGAANQRFGISVSISTTKVIIGADRDSENGSTSGAAYIFDTNGDYMQKLLAPDGESGDNFGVSVGAHTKKLVVGSHSDDDNGNGSGSMYIFYF